jgi:hypothetical protein
MILSLAGCFVATKEAVIPEPIRNVRVAIDSVICKTGFEQKKNRTEAYFYVEGNHSLAKYARYLRFDKADYFVSRLSGTARNNTSTFGVINLTEVDSATTNYQASFITPNGDPDANACLFYELTRQELLQRRDQMLPATNEIKSETGFYLRNIVSSTWSFHYAQKDNPLFTRSAARQYLWATGFMDILSYGGIAAGLAARKNKQRVVLISISALVGGIFRLVSSQAIVDIRDYNSLARSPYNLKEARE